MQYEDILFEKQEKIVVLTLNRPDIRNAITGEGMIREIEEACSIVQEDEEVCALILTGAGTAFSAGGNVKDMQAREGMFAGGPEQVRENYRKGIQRIPWPCNTWMSRRLPRSTDPPSARVVTWPVCVTYALPGKRPVSERPSSPWD